MSAQLRLARPEDLDRLLAMVAACHSEAGRETDPDTLSPALSPLLDGTPLGCAYLIGPARAPLGYAIITFGWSIEAAGMTACLEQIYMRPAIRRRGIATEVMLALPKALASGGIAAMTLRADEPDQKLWLRAGFRPRDRATVLEKPL